MKAILFGATGMVGMEVLDQCLESEQIQQVVTIGRKAPGIKHPKLLEMKHKSFLDYSSLEQVLSKADICFYCLGVYQNKVPKETFWEITVDYLDALLGTLERVNTSITFCLFSAQGADPNERSPFLFAKAKGRAEKILSDSKISTRYIFRPGFINPAKKSKKSMVSVWAFRLFYKLVPSIGIDASELAKVMVNVSLNGNEKYLLENRDLRSVAKNIQNAV